MKKNNLYILLGCTIDPTDQKYQHDTYFKSGVSVSNSEYERKLLNGFKELGEDVVFISAPVCGTYPLSSKRAVIKGFKSNKNLKIVKYNCTLFLRNHSKTRALCKELSKIVKENYRNKKIHIIACELHMPYLKCLKIIKRHYNDIFTTIIALDIPKHVNATTKLRQFLKKKEDRKVISVAQKEGDSFVCLTPPINSYVNRLNKPFVISQGIIEQPRIQQTSKEKASRTHCLYIGKVDARNGIEIIINAARLLPDVIFDICGTGDYDLSNIRNIPNIEYHGFVTQQEAEDYIENSDIVLSPRLPFNEEYLSYSFPSKIFSYIAHNKPIITYHIPCYKDTIFESAFTFPKGLTPRCFADSIIELEESGFQFPKEIYQKIIEDFSSNKLAVQISKLRTNIPL